MEHRKTKQVLRAKHAFFGGKTVTTGRTVAEKAIPSTRFLLESIKNCGRQQFLPQSLALVADKFVRVWASKKFVALRGDSSETRPEIIIGKSTRPTR